ncbi:MAG: tRNA (N(6)-L-threonylcarbamoyladenosine(37)-C(2))-methylthiotransferase MtaB [Bacteroidales bacterium]|nr:tRNA (N(6)-L-threonylcarbamoyladenosine(37)-C(2))-methylthiotransferase MtaB [Bacteroidales bacterium]
MPSIAFHTLGCKLNFAESSHLLRLFKQKGFQENEFHKVSDVYVINTCTVTSVAEKKCRAAIRQAKKLNPDAVIAVIGCFSQVNAKEIEKIDGVSIILGNDDKNQLVDRVLDYLENINSVVENINSNSETKNSTKTEITQSNTTNNSDKQTISSDNQEINLNKQGNNLRKTDKNTINAVVDINSVKTFAPSISFEDRTRGFLKVQDGCDYFCTYCEIPFARGRSRSCSVEQAVHYAKLLEQENKKEIVLTGVNIGDFGKGTNENFLDLIKALDSQTSVARYRISSIEPDLLTKDIIDFCANSRAFLPHFHIPLQSGSNVVLKSMNRHYNREEFAEKVLYIQSVMPNCFIACDCLAGFNSETEEEFQSCLDFLASLPIAFIHVFTYSDRPDTKAYRIEGKVPVNERRKRSERLQELSDRKKREFYLRNVGYKAKVLWEEADKEGKMYGFSDNYLRCVKDYDSNLVNQITDESLDILSPDNDLFIL